MSTLSRGDSDLHYEDGNHRTTPPTARGRALEAHERRLRKHLDAHTAALGLTRLCRDEDCPNCGFPETYAEVDFSKSTPGADAFGCSQCGWRKEAVTQ